jgi:TRAP-type uncharacterized transport system substrate-binding protein
LSRAELSAFVRRHYRWPLVWALSASVVACTNDSSSAQFLSIGSAPPGGAFFIVGGALAEVLTARSDNRWEATSEATKGTLESIRRLDRGELELGLLVFLSVRLSPT